MYFRKVSVDLLSLLAACVFVSPVSPVAAAAAISGPPQCPGSCLSAIEAAPRNTASSDCTRLRVTKTPAPSIITSTSTFTYPGPTDISVSTSTLPYTITTGSKIITTTVPTYTSTVYSTGIKTSFNTVTLVATETKTSTVPAFTDQCAYYTTPGYATSVCGDACVYASACYCYGVAPSTVTAQTPTRFDSTIVDSTAPATTLTSVSTVTRTKYADTYIVTKAKKTVMSTKKVYLTTTVLATTTTTRTSFVATVTLG